MIRCLLIVFILSGCGYAETSEAIVTSKDCEKNTSSIEVLMKCAENGNVNSQFALGAQYMQGIGVKQDFHKVFHWTKIAADQGIVGAQINLGKLYELGLGVEQDYQKAFEWTQKAANKGSFIALNNLADYYNRGVGVERDVKKATGYYKILAEKGDAGGQMNLGFAYFYGVGIEKDIDKSIKWITKAADQGFEPAMLSLASTYQDLGNQKEAIFWARKAVKHSNGALAQATLGNVLALSNDKLYYDEAMELLDAAMKRGESRAFFLMGSLHSERNNIFPYDESKAYQYYLQAVEMKYAPAQYQLGNWLMKGRYVHKNELEALKLYEASAEAGIQEAIQKLVEIYHKGTSDISKDEAKAQYWQNKLINVSE